jgi:DNA-binding MurR/RpiR family transcriptional regulator
MQATAGEPLTVNGAGDVLSRARRVFDQLSPELRRAARWLCDHEGDVALLSMRQQARSAGVSPPTMVRLARALGFADYASLRRPFQVAMTGRRVFGRRATALQRAPAATRIGRLASEILAAQSGDLESVQTQNTPAQIESAARAIASARRVGFLGVRSAFSIAFYFRYAYNLIATNGVLFDGLGSFLLDQAEALDRGDVLVAISQLPYSAPTVEAVEAAHRRGVTIIALTDSVMSPLARAATHTLLFRTESLSFLPSMIAPLALVELLLAQIAARGGRRVLDRLADVESRLEASHAYWREPAQRRSR